MRFKQYLLEAAPFNLEKFKKDCAPFIEQISGIRRNTTKDGLLWRGFAGNPSDWSVMTWEERRKPRNTPEIAHDMFNDFFKKKFGANARNWMFATGDKREAASYDTVAAIFPIGNFEWICGGSHTAVDLTMWLNDNIAMVSQQDDENVYDEDELIYQAASDTVDQMMQTKWYHNTNLDKCIDSHAEIMLKCDRYYSFNPSGKTFNSDEFQEFLETMV